MQQFKALIGSRQKVRALELAPNCFGVRDVADHVNADNASGAGARLAMFGLALKRCSHGHVTTLTRDLNLRIAAWADLIQTNVNKE
jgi:hypothetical protein